MGGYTKNIGYVGSVSLLVTSITGPGVVAIPAVFQAAGWILPTLMFILIGVLTGVACLLIIEACSMFPDNQGFARNVEFTVLVHQFYGRYWYYAIIFLLYGSLQSVNIASIVGSAQVFDNVLISVFGQTCGFGISPINGMYCVYDAGTGNSPFDGNYMLFTFGYLVAAAFIIPLTMIDLNDNIILQLLSCVYNLLFILTLLGKGLSQGFDTKKMPAFGSHIKGVIGNVLFNFSMANEIPSWVNITHPRVSIHKSIWTTIAISCGIYILTGILGGLIYTVDDSTNLLQAMINAPTTSTGDAVWMWFIYILFPIMTYATSIPIAMIIVKMNFVAAKICSPSIATMWAVYFPFLIGIPIQTGELVTLFGTWTSVTFQALCNFIAPFIIYLFIGRRKLEMAQSVMDELEFLDIAAGIKKFYDDDDDFDYIYHLPHADPSRIVYRDPFKKKEDAKDDPKSDDDDGNGEFLSKAKRTKSISQLSARSKHSIKEIRQMLDPALLGGPRKSRLRGRESLAPSAGVSARVSNISLGGSNLAAASSSALRKSQMISGSQYFGGSQFMDASRDPSGIRASSNANLGTFTGTGHLSTQGSDNRSRGDLPNISVNLGSTSSGSNAGGSSKRGALDLYARRPSINPGVGRRISTLMAGPRASSVAPSENDDDAMILTGHVDEPHFYALPSSITKYLPTRYVAMFGLIVMILLVLISITVTFSSSS